MFGLWAGVNNNNNRPLYITTVHIIHLSFNDYHYNCGIGVYQHLSCEFESRSWRGILDTTLCDKVCQLIVAGQWFSTGTPVPSTNKADPNDITEILWC